MGCAPSYWEVKTPDQLRASKAGAERAEPSDFTKKLWADGHAKEAQIRDRLNESWYDFQPACFELGEYGASLDGWDEASGEWMETKGPKNSNFGDLPHGACGEPIQKPVPAIPCQTTIGGSWFTKQRACLPDSAIRHAATSWRRQTVRPRGRGPDLGCASNSWRTGRSWRPHGRSVLPWQDQPAHRTLTRPWPSNISRR